MFRPSTPTIASLKREIIDDSVTRKKKVERLIKLVREEERDRVIGAMEKARQQAERR